MPKYRAPPFTVIITWFDDNGKFRKKLFAKYAEAVKWANCELPAQTINVKIMGELILCNDEPTTFADN